MFSQYSGKKSENRRNMAQEGGREGELKNGSNEDVRVAFDISKPVGAHFEIIEAEKGRCGRARGTDRNAM